MKIYNFSLLTLCILFSFTNCENKETEEINEVIEYDCLIINQGNYSESNGELSVITLNGEVKNQLYRNSNQWTLASIIESAIPYKTSWILFCANEDKIEIVSKDKFKQESCIKGIPTPRYGTIINDFLYVTSVRDWDNSASGKLFKIDLVKKTIVKEVSLGNLPEGILLSDEKIWVAATDTIYVINPESDRITHRIPTKSTQMGAKHLIEDNMGNIWCSLTSHKEKGEFIQIDKKVLNITKRISIPYLSYEGHLNFSKGKESIYYLTTKDVIGGQNPDGETNICKWDIKTETNQIIVKGCGLYGFNIEPESENIYTANVNGFITNSLLYIYNKEGNLIEGEKLVGVGACRFLFR